MWGSTYSNSVALGNKVEEDAQLQVRADANASVMPPGGPNSDADGSGGSDIKTRLRKDVDAIVLTSRYRFEWMVETTCRPVGVSINIDGEVSFSEECLPESGFLELWVVKALEFAELRSRTRGRANAVMTVDSCCGDQVTCSMFLIEP
jgi:hypothetical protein